MSLPVASLLDTEAGWLRVSSIIVPNMSSGHSNDCQHDIDEIED